MALRLRGLAAISASSAVIALRYYDPNPNPDLIVEVERVDEGKPFLMETTTGDLRSYKRFARFKLVIDGVEAQLTIFETPFGFFLPFADAEVGIETYPAGRYLEPERLSANRFHVDLNLAYNPLCAYSSGCCCPITPLENRISVQIGRESACQRGNESRPNECEDCVPMVAAERTQTMTAEEFFAFASLPENRDRMLELEDGEVIEITPVRNINSILGMRAGQFVSTHVYANDLGYVTGADGGYRIGPKTIRQPDVGFISRARAGELNQVGFPVAPDLAVEVVSPDEDVLRKAREYLAAGTRLVWAIYALEKIVLVITRKPDGGYDVRELGIDDTLDGADVLPGLQIPLKQLFSS